MPLGDHLSADQHVDVAGMHRAELCLQGTSLYFSCMANGTSRMYHSQDLLALIAGAGLRVASDEPIGLSHTLLTCVA